MGRGTIFLNGLIRILSRDVLSIFFSVCRNDRHCQPSASFKALKEPNHPGEDGIKPRGSTEWSLEDVYLKR